MRLIVVVAGLAAIAISASAAGGRTAVNPCRGGNLTGAFAVVLGSPGAGSISYDLRVRNRSAASCYVSGIPRLRLLGKSGTPLPTKVIRVSAGRPVPARLVLRPGAYAAATARFSPDIPGPGEPQRARCEPLTYNVRVTPASNGSLVVPAKPPTSVCEHGTIQLTVLVAGGHGPRS